MFVECCIFLLCHILLYLVEYFPYSSLQPLLPNGSVGPCDIAKFSPPPSLLTGPPQPLRWKKEGEAASFKTVQGVDDLMGAAPYIVKSVLTAYDHAGDGAGIIMRTEYYGPRRAIKRGPTGQKWVNIILANGIENGKKGRLDIQYTARVEAFVEESKNAIKLYT